MKKAFVLDQGEVTLVVPDKLSTSGFDKLEALMLSSLRTIKVQAMAEDNLVKLGQSKAGKIINDDAPGPQVS